MKVNKYLNRAEELMQEPSGQYWSPIQNGTILDESIPLYQDVSDKKIQLALLLAIEELIDSLRSKK